MTLKRFAIVAAYVTLLGAVGCGNTDKNVNNEKAAKKLKIGVSVPAADHGWTAGVGYWAKTEMAKYPEIDWVYATAGESNRQTADIEEMMAQNVDGLVILAYESAPLTPVAEKAKQRGIFIVSVDRGFLTPIADVFLEGDNKAFGRKSAEYIVEKLHKKGKVAILRGAPTTVDTDRYESAMAVFKANPGIEVLAAQAGNWRQEDALKVTQTYLAQFPHIDCLWASDDDMALGAEKAIQEAGRSREMWILGGAGMKNIVKRVMDKDAQYPADITYPPAMIAAGIDIAAAQLKNGNMATAAGKMPEHLGITQEQLEKASASPGQKKVTIDVFLITPENASKFYFPESVF